jgi:eukaryotic-like serine/threonine-protein kinase
VTPTCDEALAAHRLLLSSTSEAMMKHSIEQRPPEYLLDGRYRIGRRIGIGGTATVYQAEHTLIGRPVAIKVMHAQFAEDAGCVRRFLAEGRAAGTLGHPHIVESTDLGYTASGAPFLVLELLSGTTIQDQIRRAGPMPVDRAVVIAAQIASALAAAHARGIIHRDLKSANVFLVDRAGADHVKVIDFGISKLMEDGGHTEKGLLMGTPMFMSPEQIEDPTGVDGRCDIYALGVILYEMLTGRLPFADEPFPQVLSKIMWEDPPAIEAMRPDVPVEVASLVRGAMARSLAERFQTMKELGAALARLGRTATGTGVTPAPCLMRRRRPRLAALAALALAAGVLVGALTARDSRGGPAMRASPVTAAPGTATPSR